MGRFSPISDGRRDGGQLRNDFFSLAPPSPWVSRVKEREGAGNVRYKRGHSRTEFFCRVWMLPPSPPSLTQPRLEAGGDP